MTEIEKAIDATLTAYTGTDGNTHLYTFEQITTEQYQRVVLDALRRTAEDDKAREEGLLVRLPCKPNETFLHRNYDTGALELNIALHDFDGSTRELPWEEIDRCAYWE